jgi:hypothetical protein
VKSTDAANAELFAAAGRLAERSNRGIALELTQLKGGRNNRVFRVEMLQGPPLVLKSYFFDPRDPRDRLTAEWSFIQYAWSRGVRAIPEPLAAESRTHTALYSFALGRKLTSDQIGVAEVDAAADFVLAVNSAPRDFAALPPGSEACFSLSQHLTTVARRVARLDMLDPEAPQRAEAERFIHTRLTPAWRDLQTAIVASAARTGIDVNAALDDAAHCLSPSDFGFHNALCADESFARQPTSLTFLDFEYAGRDDPAKLVCDFFCQPERPVPLEYFDRFLARLACGLSLGPQDLARCRLLLDAYRIKWTCIILNEFLTLGSARRAFADQDDLSASCAIQLRKADAMLSEVTFS